MKDLIRNLRGGGICEYSAPELDVTTVLVEKGFAATGLNSADNGYDGVTGNDNGDY